MTPLTLLLALLVASPPPFVRVAPGGPVLLADAGLVVDRDGTLLAAERLIRSGEEQWAEAWRTARGTIVAIGGDSRPLSARAYGPLAASPQGTSALHYPCATRGDYPIGGPAEVGAVIAPQGDGSLLLIGGWSGVPEWRDGLSPADVVLGGPFLVPPPGLALVQHLGLAPAGLAVEAISPDGLFIQGLLKTGREAAPAWFRRAFLGAQWTPLEGLPGQTPLDIVGTTGVFVSDLSRGASGPYMVDLATGTVLREPRGWMTEDLPVGVGRAVMRADGPWYEWRGMSVNPVTGGVRVCWDDPRLWAPSPDGQWSAVIDAYRPAAPLDWEEAPPAPQEVWLAILPAGSEQEVPMLRPQARWAQPVARHLEEWPPLRLAPVWSLDGSLVACGERVFRADSGQMVGELLGADPWPVAFTATGALLWVEGTGGATRLWEWTEGARLPTPPSLSRVLPLSGG